MGTGASIREQEASTALPSTGVVTECNLSDRYWAKLGHYEETLAREQRLCYISGFESAAPYAQPLMMEKLGRSLRCHDDVFAAYSEDQRRCIGHAEVPAEALTSGGAVRSLCLLGDTATVACASSNGPLWVYNWREGAVVSQVRDGGDGGGSYGGSVRRLCAATEDCSVLASGDDRGMVALWDLASAGLSCEARLHEAPVTGLQSDGGRLVSTSKDTYIMVYDVHQQQVIDRGVPKSCTSGSGVPNTVLSLCTESMRKLVLVGGADGKLRVWTKDDGPLTRICTVSCKAEEPTQCCVLSDGFRVAISTVQADAVQCGVPKPTPGGLLLMDLRKLGGEEENNTAVIAQYGSQASEQNAAAKLAGLPATGSLDMSLVEENGETLALCLMDGVVRAFRIDGPGGTLEEKFSTDIVAKYDPGAWPCAIAATGRLVFTATSAPSLGIWRRPPADEPYGHSDYHHSEPPPPLVLRARCAPLINSSKAGGGGGAEVAATGSALSNLMKSLEADRIRLTPFGPQEPMSVA
mmetsp:Transcript_81548/g.174765  ORF Transcript_81548/g.174765 Transcript_81548/m.174765 type:complete len:522 (-) Transcript_81548:137-1702(-)